MLTTLWHFILGLPLSVPAVLGTLGPLTLFVEWGVHNRAVKKAGYRDDGSLHWQPREEVPQKIRRPLLPRILGWTLIVIALALAVINALKTANIF